VSAVRPTVSVALCTYNGARYVEEQVRSILGQDYAPLELVVSDDGSTDDTLALVRAVVAEAKSDIPLRVISGGPRLGVTLNFERAVAACQGDLIALSDQDDVWRADRLSTVVPLFEHDADLLLVNSDARLVDAGGVPFGAGLFASLGLRRGERLQISEGRAFDALIRRNLVTGAATLFRRTLLQWARPFPPEWVHDEWLGLVAAAMGRVELSSEQLIDYRQHANNQIGVAERTVRYRVGKVLEPRGDRYVRLAARWRILADRLDGLATEPSNTSLADGKVAFEVARAGLPAGRFARLRPVLREYRKGSYARFSSQGTLDVVRDIIQPARDRSARMPGASHPA
jgi:glycosyltransferase involved in cell wall biosynthesis